MIKVKHATTRQYKLIQACAVTVQGDRHRVLTYFSHYPFSMMIEGAMWCLVGERTADLQNVCPKMKQTSNEIIF